MGSSSASCRSATIRRPAAYKAAALPAELRQHYRNPPRLSGCRLPEKPARQRRKKQVGFSGERAIDRIRTGDLRITRALLCQLSYDGEDRSGMRNGGWAMRAKEFLSCDRFMPPIANYLPFGNPAFRMWPLGPSCFDGIRTRIATDDASYLWKTKPCCGYDAGKAVLFRPLRCKVRALTIVPLRPNMAAGGWRR